MGVDSRNVNVLADEQIAKGSGLFHWPTVPQLYVKANSSAAATVITVCVRQLDALFAENGVTYDRTPPDPRNQRPNRKTIFPEGGAETTSTAATLQTRAS
jgi:hypothetical protein